MARNIEQNLLHVDYVQWERDRVKFNQSEGVELNSWSMICPKFDSRPETTWRSLSSENPN